MYIPCGSVTQAVMFLVILEVFRINILKLTFLSDNYTIHWNRGIENIPCTWINVFINYVAMMKYKDQISER